MGLIRSVTLSFALAALIPTTAGASHSAYLGIETSWGGEGTAPGQFEGSPPHALATAPDGSVYTLQSPHTITHFDREGNLLARWGGRPGDPTMNLPQDIAVGASGAVYVTVNPDDRVLKFSPSGDLLADWDGTNGSPALRNPDAVTTDPTGNIYVSESVGEDSATLQLEEDGTVVRQVFAAAYGFLARDSEGYFFGTRGNGVVVERFTPAGTFDGLIGLMPLGREPGHFSVESGAWGVTVAADGTIWAADASQQRIQRFTRDGELLDVCGGTRDTDVFDFPQDAAASGDDLFVADAMHVRRVGRVTHPAPACDALPPRLNRVRVGLRGGRDSWFRRSSLHLSSDEPAHARLVISKRVRRDEGTRWRRRGRGRADVHAGRNRVKLASAFGRRLRPRLGRYRITARLRDEAGNRSSRRKVTFRVHGSGRD